MTACIARWLAGDLKKVALLAGNTLLNIACTILLCVSELLSEATKVRKQRVGYETSGPATSDRN